MLRAAFCSVPRSWLVTLPRRCSAFGRCKQLSFRFLFEKWRAYCQAYARWRERLLQDHRVHAAGIDALLGGLKRNGFSYYARAPCPENFPKCAQGRRCASSRSRMEARTSCCVETPRGRKGRQGHNKSGFYYLKVYLLLSCVHENRKQLPPNYSYYYLLYLLHVNV